MNLLVGTDENISAIMELLAQCIGDMQSKDIDQWGHFYPTEQVIREDIQKQKLYIYQQKFQVIGIVVLDCEQDELYDNLQWHGDDNFLVVHRLAITPAFQKQGYATKIMDWIEAFASTNSYTSIRLDAYTGNPAAMNLYETRGYIKTGQVSYPHRTLPFNCYEKATTSP